jgi:hypothetical protein
MPSASSLIPASMDKTLSDEAFPPFRKEMSQRPGFANGCLFEPESAPRNLPRARRCSEAFRPGQMYRGKARFQLNRRRRKKIADRSRRCRHPRLRLRGWKRSARKAAGPTSEDDNSLGLGQPPGRLSDSPAVLSSAGPAVATGGGRSEAAYAVPASTPYYIGCERTGPLRASVGSTEAGFPRQ